MSSSTRDELQFQYEAFGKIASSIVADGSRSNKDVLDLVRGLRQEIITGETTAPAPAPEPAPARTEALAETAAPAPSPAAEAPAKPARKKPGPKPRQKAAASNAEKSNAPAGKAQPAFPEVESTSEAQASGAITADMFKDAPEPPPQKPVIPKSQLYNNDKSKMRCLACGKEFSMIKRHLRESHGMTPEQYKKLYDLPLDTPDAAPGYSKQKSAFAKRTGLGHHRSKSSAN